MANVNDIIQDPSIALLGVPRAPISSDPFTAGQRFAFTNDREREAQAFLEALAGNNQLRSLMQQRLNTHEQQLERLKQLEQIRETIGAEGAAGAAGLPVTGFSSARVPVDFAQLQATAQGTASDAALAGAKAGQLPVQSQAFSGVTGFNVQQQTPIGEAQAIAAAKVPTIENFIRGTKVKQGAPADIAAESVARARGQPTASAGKPGQGVPTEAQTAKFTDIIEKLATVSPGKEYRFTIRPDGVMVVIETDTVTGEEIEVFKFGTNGQSISE